MKKFCIILVIVVLCLGLIGCDAFKGKKSAEDKQSEQTNLLLDEVNRQIGLPNILNFKQKKIMKLILEECDKENLLCYAYLQSAYTGKLIYIGKCMGYGVPFAAQFTSPQKIVRKWGTRYVMPQADPNMLYMPTATSATWLLMIDPDNKKPRLVYFEPTIVVSPFKLIYGVEK